MKKNNFIFVYWLIITAGILINLSGNAKATTPNSIQQQKAELTVPPNLIQSFRTVLQIKREVGVPQMITNFNVITIPKKDYNYVLFTYVGNCTFESDDLVIPKNSNFQQQFQPLYNSIIMKVSALDGKILWHQKIFGIHLEAMKETSLGDLQFFGSISYTIKPNTIKLGDKEFTTPDNLTYGRICGTMNVTNQTWQNVQIVSNAFIYNHFFDNDGNYYIAGQCKGESVKINNKVVTESGNSDQMNVFIAKFNSSRKLLWAKRSHWVGDEATSLYNILFDVDDVGNVYITGGIGHRYGHLQIGGIEVKNDTISHKDDYSFTDIFLYKINSQGNVVYGKTYLQRGNEIPNYIETLNNGNLYLCGSYTREMGIGGNQFPPCNSEDYYSKNAFIGKIDASTGNFIFGVGIDNASGGEKIFMTDKDKNVYFAVRFKKSFFDFMGKRYYNRTISNPKVGNLFIGKISSFGQKIWANVLGAETKFETIVQDERLRFISVGNQVLLIRERMEYGSNSQLEWGNEKKPSSTSSNSVIINKETGELLYNVVKRNNLANNSLFENPEIKGYNCYSIDQFSGFSINGFREPQCPNGCSMTVKVQQKGQPIDAIIELYNLNRNPSSPLFTSETENGEVVFDNVTDGTYIIRVIEEEKGLDTYYPNKIIYEEAKVFYFPQNNSEENPNNEFTIELQPIPESLIGNGTISGHLTFYNIWKGLPQKENKNTQKNNVQNNNYNLYLKNNETKKIIAYTQSDEDGNYTFNNVPNGTYTVLLDIAERKIKVPNIVTISSNNSMIENADYDIYYNGVFGKITSDVFDVKLDNSIVSVFPNPATEFITIKLNREIYKSDRYTINLRTIDGKLIKQLLVKSTRLKEGVKLPIKSYASGFYVLQISNKGTILTKSIIIK